MEFIVIDKVTGKEADAEKIALTEEWAKGLAYCDIDGFAITECGDLILLDECSRYVYVSRERFEVKFAERTCKVIEYNDYGPHAEDCTMVFSCGHETLGYIPNYCPSCGAKVVE